jgi:hypothetical protein
MAAPAVVGRHEAKGHPMRNASSRNVGRSLTAARALEASAEANMMFNLMMNAGIAAAAISLCSLLIYLAP